MHVKDGCFKSQPIAGESTKIVSPRLEFLDLGSNQINGVFLDLKLLILRSNPFRGVVMEVASSQNRVWVSEAAQHLPFSKYSLPSCQVTTSSTGLKWSHQPCWRLHHQQRFYNLITFLKSSGASTFPGVRFHRSYVAWIVGSFSKQSLKRDSSTTAATQ